MLCDAKCILLYVGQLSMQRTQIIVFSEVFFRERFHANCVAQLIIAVDILLCTNKNKEKTNWGACVCELDH